MLFTSYTFYLFLGLVLVCFWALPWKLMRWVLVGASYVFYGAVEPWYCFLLLASTFIDYSAALAIHKCRERRHRKRFLQLSLVLNLGILGVFKYADFGIANLNQLLQWFDIAPYAYLDWLLPIGISFYTFQTISYTWDVYRGKIEPTRDFCAFSLYVAFFPQLVAGPIERAGKLLPQFFNRPQVTRSDIEQGFQRVLWGLIKKLVIADRLALMVNPVYANPSAYSASELLVATLCFSFQLYLDFSAYTDIAIGIARMMGIRLSENFNYPFLATNPSDFWSRWHMTLTSWFRDYVFASLGGIRRRRPLTTMLAIIGTMSLVGLWHGAAWNYVLFGFLSGITIVVHQGLRLRKHRDARGPLFGSGWWSPIAACLVANIAINVIMVFFRAGDLNTAGSVFGGIFFGDWGWSGEFNLQLSMLAALWAGHVAFGLYYQPRDRTDIPAVFRGCLWACAVLIILYGAVENTERFIYFQF